MHSFCCVRGYRVKIMKFWLGRLKDRGHDVVLSKREMLRKHAYCTPHFTDNFTTQRTHQLYGIFRSAASLPSAPDSLKHLVFLSNANQSNQMPCSFTGRSNRHTLSVSALSATLAKTRSACAPDSDISMSFGPCGYVMK